VSVINRSRLHRSQLQGLDLLGKQSVRNAIPVAEAAVHAAAPGEDGAVGGDSEAVFGSRRNGDDALPCQGFDLLGLARSGRGAQDASTAWGESGNATCATAHLR